MEVNPSGQGVEGCQTVALWTVYSQPTNTWFNFWVNSPSGLQYFSIIQVRVLVFYDRGTVPIFGGLLGDVKVKIKCLPRGYGLFTRSTKNGRRDRYLRGTAVSPLAS